MSQRLGAYGAVMICRKIIMHIAVERGAKAGEKFAWYLSILRDKGFVPPDHGKVIEHIKDTANKMNHTMDIPDEESATRLLVFTEHMLRFLYDFPAQMGSADNESETSETPPQLRAIVTTRRTDRRPQVRHAATPRQPPPQSYSHDDRRADVDHSNYKIAKKIVRSWCSVSGRKTLPLPAIGVPERPLCDIVKAVGRMKPRFSGLAMGISKSLAQQTKRINVAGDCKGPG